MQQINNPPKFAIIAAIEAAKNSTCTKSRRGISIFSDHLLISIGTNSIAYGKCTGDDICKQNCNKICTHAEINAIYNFYKNNVFSKHEKDVSILHVKINEDGNLETSKNPSCWQCSRYILQQGFKGVWLFEQINTNDSNNGEWKFYNSTEFHLQTLDNCNDIIKHDDKLGKFLKIYDDYLDRKIEYKDLPNE